MCLVGTEQGQRYSDFLKLVQFFSDLIKFCLNFYDKIKNITKPHLASSPNLYTNSNYLTYEQPSM